MNQSGVTEIEDLLANEKSTAVEDIYQQTLEDVKPTDMTMVSQAIRSGFVPGTTVRMP